MIHPAALVMPEGVTPFVFIGANPGTGVDLRIIQPGFAGAVGKYFQLLAFYPVPFPGDDFWIKPALTCRDRDFSDGNLFLTNTFGNRTNCHGIKTPKDET